MRARRWRRPAGGRQGITLVYLTICLVTLLAVSSLAVDFGRWQLCKTQLQRSADAAARAGAYRLASDPSTALATATAVASANLVDAQAVGGNPQVTVTATLLQWTSATNYVVLPATAYASANAVRVTIGYPLPMTFGSALGLSTKAAARSATARVVTQSEVLTVGGTGDLWLAGEPTGTRASKPDASYAGPNVNPLHPWQYDYAGPVGGTMASGEPYSSPAQSQLPIAPGAILTGSNVSGTANYAPGNFDSGSADGTVDGATASIFHDSASSGGAEHGIADVHMPGDSLNAVFLGPSVPDGTAAPSALDFSTAAARDYTSLSPKAKQPFYVGTGQTSGGNARSIVVPAGATRLFMGVMDCWEWDNNTGAYTATLTVKTTEMVQ